MHRTDRVEEQDAPWAEKYERALSSVSSRGSIGHPSAGGLRASSRRLKMGWVWAASFYLTVMAALGIGHPARVGEIQHRPFKTGEDGLRRVTTTFCLVVIKF